MTIVPGPLASAAPADGVPREYNFAADILERNLRAGRAQRPPVWISDLPKTAPGKIQRFKLRAESAPT